MEKRILHVVSSLSKSSGVMCVILNYFKNIDREKINFDFLFFQDLNSTYKEEIEKLGGKVYLCPNPKSIFQFLGYINRFFDEKYREYIAIHLHEVYLNSLILPIAKKHGITHRIIHSHATKYSDLRINSLRNKILCIPLKRNANHLMACSKAAGAFLYGDKPIAADKVYILNNAIDTEKFKYSPSIRENVRKELQLENKLVVGHVGRFNDQKNHAFLIKIYAEVYKREKNSILILVGEGPLEERVQAQVKELKLDNNVLFLGARNDVYKIIQAMDIFVLPSIYEGLPLIGVEAQASGLNSIISDTVTDEVKISELVVFKNLELSPAEWADDIFKIVYTAQRYDTSKKVIEAGFDIKSTAKKMQEFYMELAK